MTSKPRNWWMVGYRAAMVAKHPDDLEAELATTMKHCSPIAREQFIEGWKSVWKCERRHEVTS